MAGAIVIIVIVGFIGLYIWGLVWSRQLIAGMQNATVIRTSLSTDEASDVAYKLLRGVTRLGVVQRQGHVMVREFRSMQGSTARLQVDVTSEGQTVLYCEITDASWTSRYGIKQVAAISKANTAVKRLQRAVRKRDADLAVLTV